MKKFLHVALTATILFLAFACSKEEDEADQCKTCNGCQGLAQLYNGREFCISGFDNKSDWETFIRGRETDDNCTCE